jgi:predicted dithiol-disulfide oxidoreductase (DUF899 family)
LSARLSGKKKHEELLAKEKAHTRASDALAAERRRQPMAAVTKKYAFTGEKGEVGLAELFEGRHQLIVYHHMLKPADDSPCPGCCLFTDMVCDLTHLHARDTTFAIVARAPINEITALKKRMGWDIPWYSTTDSFNPDFLNNHSHGLNIFLQDAGNIYHTYFNADSNVRVPVSRK